MLEDTYQMAVKRNVLVSLGNKLLPFLNLNFPSLKAKNILTIFSNKILLLLFFIFCFGIARAQCPTFTVSPAANSCISTDVTYTTEAGQTNYVWNVPGVLGTDYIITSGGISSTDNTVTLQWITTGSKTVTVNYDNSSSCADASTTTTVNALPTPAFTASPGATTCASTDVTYTTEAG